MAERSEAKSEKQIFASKIKISNKKNKKYRYAQPFLAKLKWTIYWSLSRKG